MTDKLRITILNTQGGGVNWWRHSIPARALRRRGHEVWHQDEHDTAMPAIAPWDFLRKRMHESDIVHTGFSTNPDYIGWMATLRNTALEGLGRALPVVTDIDDDILNVPHYNTAYAAYALTREAQRAALMHLRTSDAVSVTTPPLVELYAPAARSVSVLPNAIDPADWADLPTNPARTASRDIRIVFAGGIGRKGDLDTVQEALESVMRQRPNVRIFFMGMMPDWAAQWMPSRTDPTANRAFFIQPASPYLYRRIMRWMGFDIALAPVAPNAFNASKSDIKILDATLAGAATVCSDFTTYADVPADATLKCSTTYEWRESLLALIDDAALRARKLTAAHKWVMEVRHIDAVIERWEHFYEEALSRPVIGSDGEHVVEPPRVDRPGLVTAEALQNGNSRIHIP